LCAPVQVDLVGQAIAGKQIAIKAAIAANAAQGFCRNAAAYRCGLNFRYYTRAPAAQYSIFFRHNLLLYFWLPALILAKDDYRLSSGWHILRATRLI
jgi:hypothetical protein